MRVIAALFGPYAPDALPSPVSVFSHDVQTPPDLVVDHETSAVESSSSLDFLTLHALWIPCGRLIGYKIMSIISVGCDFTTKSGGIWFFLIKIFRQGIRGFIRRSYRKQPRLDRRRIIA